VPSATATIDPAFSVAEVAPRLFRSFAERLAPRGGGAPMTTLDSPAIVDGRTEVMRNHGVFAVGKDARSVVQAAVMCEDVARTVRLARMLGEPRPIDQARIDRLHERYQTMYGQRS
jgi:ribulose-5-phosphate 4-epimerase/fuculose-1-phosphate aldolase